ncbi:hypothetical protein CBR_g16798 [Chara braunii]|uniref:F-box domain-containing protein n=1 Tax=Chara braunii TaxID=69332 RepID=A0A388KTS9_CHABU|nr:hypothetical protein CBR_g16798 [Chara braunii]|eukprot:GBG73456.1 hypothetical protein CBR_g16798 [Chara braunii]
MSSTEALSTVIDSAASSAPLKFKRSAGSPSRLRAFGVMKEGGGAEEGGRSAIAYSSKYQKGLGGTVVERSTEVSASARSDADGGGGSRDADVIVLSVGGGGGGGGGEKGGEKGVTQSTREGRDGRGANRISRLGREGSGGGVGRGGLGRGTPTGRPVEKDDDVGHVRASDNQGGVSLRNASGDACGSEEDDSTTNVMAASRGASSASEAEPIVGAGNRRCYRSTLDSLSPELKAAIFKYLPVPDLCRMSEVNRYYRRLCSSDPLWEWRAVKMGVCKAAEERSWMWNYMAAVLGVIHAKTFDDSNSDRMVELRGDIWIGDPVHIFFTGEANKNRWKNEFLRILDALDNSDVILTYRGIASGVIQTRWGEGAYPATRRRKHLGDIFSSSGLIAVVPRPLLRILERENGKPTPEKSGILVRGVNGRICTSRDGDFMITANNPAKGVVQQIGDNLEMHVCVDVLVTTGGFWTVDSDDDDDDDEDNEDYDAFADSSDELLYGPGGAGAGSGCGEGPASEKGRCEGAKEASMELCLTSQSEHRSHLSPFPRRELLTWKGHNAGLHCNWRRVEGREAGLEERSVSSHGKRHQRLPEEAKEGS